MLKEQEAGSDKWNPCIEKYQDTFTEHAFIKLVKNGKGIDQKFGAQQRTLHTVYKEMRALQANRANKWDACIEAYKKAFPISGEDYVITGEIVFYLNNEEY